MTWHMLEVPARGLLRDLGFALKRFGINENTSCDTMPEDREFDKLERCERCIREYGGILLVDYETVKEVPHEWRLYTFSSGLTDETLELTGGWRGFINIGMEHMYNAAAIVSKYLKDGDFCLRILLTPDAIRHFSEYECLGNQTVIGANSEDDLLRALNGIQEDPLFKKMEDASSGDIGFGLRPDAHALKGSRCISYIEGYDPA